MKSKKAAFGIVSACLLAAIACGNNDGDKTPTGDNGGDSPSAPNGSVDISPTVTCDNTYALCAAAECFVYNLVAYCVCDELEGESISAPFEYTEGTGGKKNICDLNAQGVNEDSYMASTYSLPADVLEGGSQAVYTCPSNSTGAYAQCDGGLCFTSTSGMTFPGFEGTLEEDEIVCACPITSATTANSPFGYQFVGPYPCQASVFEQCTRETNTRTGTNIPVGAPSGVPRALTIALTGENPDINECFPVP